MTAVGFAGLGRMGAPMARNIVRHGFPVTVWNRTATKAEAFASANASGARIAPDPRTLAEGSDVLVTMLAGDLAVREFFGGSSGALLGLRPGAHVVDMSTVSPEASAEVGSAVRAAGARFVEAPVSGSTAAAESGSLLVMAAGEAAAVDAVRPVLEAMSAQVVHVGDVGAGVVMKLAVNTVVYGLSQAVAEALVLAERAGIDRATAYAVFCESAIAAPMVRYRRELFERPGEVEPTFALDLAVKDLRLITALATEVGVEMPQAQINLDALQRASAAGYGTWDMSAVAEHLRGRSPGSTAGAL